MGAAAWTISVIAIAIVAYLAWQVSRHSRS
jgi:hypothetical protein